MYAARRTYASERRLALHSETRLDFDRAVAREGRRRDDPPRQLQPAQRRRQIFGVAEQVRVDGGRARGSGLASVTRPRLLGYRSTTLRAKP